ncbi:MAG: arsenite methyltransferase [Chloroflexi bacterium]|nr:arsenite methyltransferase [Chloroflexota bacterium]
MSEQDLKSTVRTAYRKIALETADACSVGCCLPGGTPDGTAKLVGYTDEQLASLPEGANLGLGCGNPLAIASIKEGDVVLDLGSGAGIDCFLAAQQVGASGHVIGVDMTQEMLDRANRNKETIGLTNVEFRFGELEALPVDDDSADLVISNCVINLVPDRDKVYRETLRVLKPGGRISVSDTIQTMELPQALLDSEVAKAACISASVTKDVYLASLTDAGFVNVQIESEVPYPKDLGFEQSLLEGLRDEHGIPEEVIREAARSMVSIMVTAERPANSGACC